MEDKLKQRLTGAAILIAIAVLIVPELFRGQSTGEAVKPGTEPASLPQRSVTIQVPQPGSTRDADADQAPTSLAVDAEQHPAPESAAAAEQQNVATSAAAAEAAQSVLTKPQSMPQSKPREIPAGNAVQSSSPPVAQAQAQAPAAAAEQLPANRAPVTAASNGKAGWAVQLGVFSQRANAERLTQQAKAKGISVEVSGPDKRGFWRVRSGIQSDRAAAQRWQQKAQEGGFTAALTQAP